MQSKLTRRATFRLFCGVAIAALVPAKAFAGPLEIIAHAVRVVGDVVSVRIRIVVNSAGALFHHELGTFDVVRNAAARKISAAFGNMKYFLTITARTVTTISVKLTSAFGEITKRVTIPIPAA